VVVVLFLVAVTVGGTYHGHSHAPIEDSNDPPHLRHGHHHSQLNAASHDEEQHATYAASTTGATLAIGSPAAAGAADGGDSSRDKQTVDAAGCAGWRQWAVDAGPVGDSCAELDTLIKQPLPDSGQRALRCAVAEAAGLLDDGASESQAADDGAKPSSASGRVFITASTAGQKCMLQNSLMQLRLLGVRVVHIAFDGDAQRTCEQHSGVVCADLSSWYGGIGGKAGETFSCLFQVLNWQKVRFLSHALEVAGTTAAMWLDTDVVMQRDLFSWSGLTSQRTEAIPAIGTAAAGGAVPLVAESIVTLTAGDERATRMIGVRYNCGTLYVTRQDRELLRVWLDAAGARHGKFAEQRALHEVLRGWNVTAPVFPRDVVQECLGPSDEATYAMHFNCAEGTEKLAYMHARGMWNPGPVGTPCRRAWMGMG